MMPTDILDVKSRKRGLHLVYSAPSKRRASIRELAIDLQNFIETFIPPGWKKGIGDVIRISVSPSDLGYLLDNKFPTSCPGVWDAAPVRVAVKEWRLLRGL